MLRLLGHFGNYGKRSAIILNGQEKLLPLLWNVDSIEPVRICRISADFSD